MSTGPDGSKPNSEITLVGKTHLVSLRMLAFVRPLLGLGLVLALKKGRKLELYHYIPSVKFVGKCSFEFMGVDLV